MICDSKPAETYETDRASKDGCFSGSLGVLLAIFDDMTLVRSWVKSTAILSYTFISLKSKHL